MPLAEIVVLVNIGTLFAFLICNIAVVVLRRTRPDLERGFRVPLVPLFPIIGAGLCIYLMVDLPGTTWWRFLIWLAIGIAIYFLYGRRHSRLQRGQVTAGEAELPEGARPSAPLRPPPLTARRSRPACGAGRRRRRPRPRGRGWSRASS